MRLRLSTISNCYNIFVKETELIEKTKEFVKKTLGISDPTAHDWHHVERVLKNSLIIAKREKTADLLIVKLAALLHDIADWKFTEDEMKGGKVARKWLMKNQVSEEIIREVSNIVDTISYKGGTNPPMKSIEGKIVQDADRLDALGAIGIARAFAYGGYKNRAIYNPDNKPKLFKNAKDYKNNDGTSVNHFYEKLLLLKGMMNTRIGKKLAIKRHKILEDYLKEFYKEWEA